MNFNGLKDFDSKCLLPTLVLVTERRRKHLMILPRRIKIDIYVVTFDPIIIDFNIFAIRQHSSKRPSNESFELCSCVSEACVHGGVDIARPKTAHDEIALFFVDQSSLSGEVGPGG